MKKIRSSLVSYLLLGGIFIGAIGCAEDNKPQTVTEEPKVEIPDKKGLSSSVVKYKGEIFSIPSPIQTAILIKNANIEYNEELLNDFNNKSKYLTEFQKALNMGIYGADLAYLSNFNNMQLTLEYFAAVDVLSDELDIKNNIDPDILHRFMQNIDVQDSLHALNAELYMAANTYLEDNERNEAASLILAGGWIEAMNFALDMAHVNDDFRSRVGEQKSALNSLVALLSTYDNEQVQQVNSGLKELNDIFNGLANTYSYEKPITDVESKITYLNSKSTVEVSDEDLTSIKNKIEEIRNIIIS